jgi:hypothetical protein
MVFLTFMHKCELAVRLREELRRKFLVFLWTLVFIGQNAVIANAGVYLTHDELNRSTEFAEQSHFASVGLVRREKDGQYHKNGSGVLIAPQWVLTAAHVVTAFERQGFDRISFSTSSDGFSDVSSARVESWFVHPLYAGSVFRADLALLKLESPLLGVSSAVLYRGPELQSTNPFEEWTIQAAGFGLHGVVGEPLMDDTSKRAGANIAIDGPRESLTGPRDAMSIYTNYYPDRIDMEWKGANGDSGGGWFREVDGRWELVGITTGGHVFADGGTFAISTSRYAAWVDSFVAVPEPSSLALLFVLLTPAAAIRLRTRCCFTARR